MVLVVLAAGLAVLGAPPAAAPDGAALAEAVAAYNRSELVLTPLKIVEATPSIDAPWSPTSGTLPGSLAMLSLSQREAEALTAAVAAYGVDQDMFLQARRPSASAYLAGLVVATIVDSAIERNSRFPNDERRWQRMAAPGIGSIGYTRAAPRDGSPKQRLARIIINFGTCAGALVSVANRLKSDSTDAQLAAFVLNVRDDANWQAVPADANCVRS